MHMIKVGRQIGLGQERGRQQDAKGLCTSFQSCIDGDTKPVQTCIHYGEGDRSLRCFGSAWTSRSLRLNPDWLDRITSENILWTLGQKADGVLSP
jgi:hypothetical protein